jgi:hypothetical protein
VKGQEIVDIKEIPGSWLVVSDEESTGFNRESLWTGGAIFSREDAFGFAIVDGRNKETAKSLKGWVRHRGARYILHTYSL